MPSVSFSSACAKLAGNSRWTSNDLTTVYAHTDSVSLASVLLGAGRAELAVGMVYFMNRLSLVGANVILPVRLVRTGHRRPSCRPWTPMPNASLRSLQRGSLYKIERATSRDSAPPSVNARSGVLAVVSLSATVLHWLRHCTVPALSLFPSWHLENSFVTPLS